MPDVDARAGLRPAGGVHDLHAHGDRHARASFGDVGAHEPRIEVERPLHDLRREDAHVGVGQEGSGVRGGGLREGALRHHHAAGDRGSDERQGPPAGEGSGAGEGHDR